jgi:hypothetical protein
MNREFIVVCKRYRCKACSKEFLGTNRDSIAKLPEEVQYQYPVGDMRPKTSLDKDLLVLLQRQVVSSQSFTDFSKMYSEIR